MIKSRKAIVQLGLAIAIHAITAPNYAQSAHWPSRCAGYGNPDARAQCLAMESADNTGGHFDPSQRPSQCGGYGNPYARAQCRAMEARTQAIGRYNAARRDVQTSRLTTAAREEDSACAATMKADVAAGRYSEHDVRVVRLGRAWRSVGYCNVLRQLQKRHS